jgi:hypothetical protein
VLITEAKRSDVKSYRSAQPVWLRY